MNCGASAVHYRGALSPRTPQWTAATHPPRSRAQPPRGCGGRAPTPLHWQIPHRMRLNLGDIVPEQLHRKLGWDMRHHFMAEKIIDRFGLALPRDRELIRQLAVIYVAQGFKTPNTL